MSNFYTEFMKLDIDHLKYFDPIEKHRRAVNPLMTIFDGFNKKLKLTDQDKREIEQVIFNSLSVFEEIGFNAGYRIGADYIKRCVNEL